MNGICAFTAITEQDACWIDAYLAEAERLQMPFGVHFDRCSVATRVRMIRHPLCVANTRQTDPRQEFTEQHKQGIFDEISSYHHYKWLMAWDADETFERDAPEKLAKIATSDADNLQVVWLNLWNDMNHVRVDGPFNRPPRVKFYNLQGGRRWFFDHPVVNGAKLVPPKADYRCERTDLVCLHHGMITEELRRQKKERWDRIYSKAVGENPYKIWDFALNPEYQAVVAPNRYLP